MILPVATSHPSLEHMTGDGANVDVTEETGYYENIFISSMIIGKVENLNPFKFRWRNIEIFIETLQKLARSVKILKITAKRVCILPRPDVNRVIAKKD